MAQGARFTSFLAMTVKTTKTVTKVTKATKTVAKTTVVKKTTKTPKAILRKMTAEKKRLGMTAKKANGKKQALAQKKKAVGIFAPKTLSTDLSAICGGKRMSRVDVTKKVWAYIKAKKLSKGTLVSPDATLKKVFPKTSLTFFEMPKLLSAHLTA